MVRTILQALWDAELAQSGNLDKIAVQNLQVTVNSGKDVWGRNKLQRAMISVTVTLAETFASASVLDKVDKSTIHYGILSKAIQASILKASSNWIPTAMLSTFIADSVREVGGSTPIYSLETNVYYPKGSMFGDGVGHITSSIQSSGICSNVLYLRNLRIPCIIGVNANERLQKQPILLSLWVECLHEARVDDYAQLESFLFAEISGSEFQTLESMLEWAVRLLRQNIFTREEDKDTWMRLRIEKPLAVPFADAPAVEITRPVRLT
ncbi:hypothetical protein GQ44DRAFT_762192 [Phaeosphaeriaceae sp. PMI808]|nr:hypothetical protein GQ44DRAFT_762192 [Phaeosphaeriaceae sp. PMI808]